MKMKHIVLTASLLLITISIINAQKYYTNTAHIDFYSHAPLEDITANNDQVAALLDFTTGEVAFAVLMKSFVFEKALMQEHFNESYVESDKYPKAKLSGKILDWENIRSKKGTHNVTVQGELLIHGVTKSVEILGTINIKADELVTKTKFIVKPEDYKILIPKSKINNIAQEIEVTVNAMLTPYKK